ncbi:porin [Nitrosococcus wardiae]|uniref:Porin n=1 Tax=Nitrosococcus wardiae TaxID=1814290 RepID=A0A4P7BYP6_9GAMM|nr:porin [Nitrosococcus wardiae]QBQ53612.1 porin [Nitrosococcus wardiae]
MKNFKKTKLAVAAAAAMGLSLPAGAVVVVGGENGWEVSFDGNINQFYVYSDTEELPMGVIGGNISGNTFIDENGQLVRTGVESSRFRTGLMPALFSFNVKAPTWNGLDMGARVSFAGQTNNANTKNSDLGIENGIGHQGIGKVRSDSTDDLGSNIEFREAFFTVDGAFGQVLLGRTLSLFMGKNILTDQTLFGVGATGDVHGGGFTLGRIGYGYLYPNFNSQIRWSSPDMMGFKVALAGVDPSQICGEGSVINPVTGNLIPVASGVNCATETDTPRAEGEISYAGTFNNGSYQVWGAGMWQDAEFQNGTEVEAWGWTAGTQIQFMGFEVTGSYYDGEGLGTSFLLDADSLDATGEKRDNRGWLVQGGYTIMDRTKVAASYGRSEADETNNDELCRLRPNDINCAGAGGARIDKQESYVVGIYHDVNANLKLVAEYSRVENEWHDGQEQDADVVGVGGYFFW